LDGFEPYFAAIIAVLMTAIYWAASKS